VVDLADFAPLQFGRVYASTYSHTAEGGGIGAPSSRKPSRWKRIAPGQVGHVGGVVTVGFFDHNCVAHIYCPRLTWACLKMPFNVPAQGHTMAYQPL
jgi:hypothetical protein